jgi:regulation of enolase protein 1 (concanavalin A-like superfamily)
VQGDYHALYDQAGLMVRLDERTWMKCGIEYVGEVQHVSAVVTRDFSDWSVVPVAPPPALRLRVVRQGHTLEVSYALTADAPFTLLRQAYFPPTPEIQVGVMLCAPTGAGFDVRFEGFAVRAVA